MTSRLPSPSAVVFTALGLGVLGFGLSGCKTETPREQLAPEQAPKPEPRAQPSDGAQFLAELIPLPDGAKAIEITYAVTGPALEGELSILLAAGGNKRESWELRTTGTNDQLRSAGSAIVNSKVIWHGVEGQPGERRSNELGGLADAWAALDTDKRAAVVNSLRDWHALLDKRRAEVPGDRGEVLGVSCLQTRIAAQNLCMWEQAGVFLRYEGSAFTIEATEIDRAPTIAPDAFELPPEASGATEQPSEAIDFAAALAKAVDGNFAELFLLVSRTRALPQMATPA